MTRTARTALTLAITVAGVGAAVVLMAQGLWQPATWAAVGACTVQTLLLLLPDRRTGSAASPPSLTITRTTRGPHDG